MPLFLTSVLPFLAHDHASAVAFLTCRHHNFHASIIPKFLSDEDRVVSFCGVRQKDQLEADKEKEYRNLYNLFVHTPLMQFSPSLIVFHKDCVESILKPLLQTNYFTRSLQHCFFSPKVKINNEFLQALSKVQSLTKLDLGRTKVENEQLGIIINSFPSLETLTIQNAGHLRTVDPNTPINIVSPPPPATKTLRSLTLDYVDALFASQFVAHFSNLRKLVLNDQTSFQELDLLPLSSSLPLLTDLSLIYFNLKNTESLKNLVHLLSLRFSSCVMPSSLSFLTQEIDLPKLATLRIDGCHELSTSSFAQLSHAPNLCVLEVTSDDFDDDCLKYLENMVHLRKLNLSNSRLISDVGLLKTLMQSLFQLEELHLSECDIGNNGAIAGPLYSTHSRLRVLNLGNCRLVDDDLNGIGALKNYLEVLDLGYNYELTNKALVHCKDLVKLRRLCLCNSGGINDLSPLEDCLGLEELDVACNRNLTDDSFKVFSEEPNSFPKIRRLNLMRCPELTENVFEHLSANNNLVYQLKELNVGGLSAILSTSPTARNKLCRLQALRRLEGILDSTLSESDQNKLRSKLMKGLKNLEHMD